MDLLNNFKSFTLILLTSLFISCDTTTQNLKSDVFYPRTISITVDGTKFTGFGVLPQKASYVIKISHRKNIDMFVMTTCHRQISIYPDSEDYEFTYTPNTLEKSNCGINFDIYNIEGSHAFGYLHLSEDFYKKPASLICNGSTTNVSGTAICQSKTGLIQQIVFTSTMKIATPSSDCKGPTTQDNKTFTFNSLSSNICAYIFKDAITDTYFKLITLGYEQLLIEK